MFWMFWLQKSDMVPVISGFGLTLVIGWLRWFGWDSGDSVWMSGPGYFSFAGLFLAPIMFYLRYPELRMQEFCKNFLRRRPSPESKMASGSAPENEFFYLCSWESVCSHFSVAGRTLGCSQGVRCALWWSSRRGYGKIWRFVDYLEKLKFVVVSTSAVEVDPSVFGKKFIWFLKTSQLILSQHI